MPFLKKFHKVLKWPRSQKATSTAVLGILGLSVGLLAANSACKSRFFNARVKATDDNRALLGIGKDYLPDYECDNLHPQTGKPVNDPYLLFDADVRTIRRTPAQRLAFTQRLNSSMKERRKFAWCVGEKAFWPTQIATGDGAVSKMPTPTWLTWYEASEFQALFKKMYLAKAKATKSQFPAFTETEIDAAFAERVSNLAAKGMKRTKAAFTKPLLEKAPVPGIPETQLEMTALGGQGFTLFSPGYVRHLILNYASIANCKIPETVVVPKIFESLPKTSESNFSAPCLAEEFPPEAVMAKAVWVPVETKGVAARIPFFNTNDKALQKVFSKVDGDWEMARAGEVETNSSQMLVQQDIEGNKYGLVAIHFTTKEIRDWVWTTFWWSPSKAVAAALEAASHLDFGADRRSFGRNSRDAEIVSHYKMCATTDFDEKADLDAEYAADAEKDPAIATLLSALKTSADLVNTSPKLKNGKALAWSNDGGQKGTWCSNPYIESHPGNSHTNCIGCHQHASTGVSFSQTFYLGSKESEWKHFPKYGATRFRNTHPSDFSWGYQFEFQPFFVELVKPAQ